MAAPAPDLWASRRADDERRQQALARLARMQPSISGHGVAHGMPFADKAAYKDKHPNEEINGAIKSAPIKSVPLDKLNAIQRSVKPGRVVAFINRSDAVPSGTRDPKHGGIVDHPIVIKQDGKLFLHDGHHRAVAARLMGDTHIEVRYVDFDEQATKAAA